ncbi:MAG: HlyD family type I secretion periplasmic adaptor subunit [Gammaproteobacteria bacterium]|jgi:hemolysin D
MRHEVDFLPAALEIQERPPSPAGRAIIWAIVLFFSLAVAWASIGEIDIVATAQGKIVPSGRVKIIQPMEIGVVRQIRVREGQHVERGDPLIELDPTATEADLERLETELIAARLDEARYRTLERVTADSAENGEAATVGLDVSSSLARKSDTSAIALQGRLLQSVWTEHRARCAALDNTIVSREAELAALKEEVKKRASTLPLITRRTGAVRKMVDKQLSAEQTWLELEEERVEQQQELAALKKRTQQVEASIQEARKRRQALDAEFQRELLTKLAETERRIDRLEQERIKASQRTDLQRLRAPVAGVVQQLAVHTIGGVVTPAQTLMKIVPESESLEIEAWILNKDIGFVEEGQRAEIKIATFPFTRYGTIDGQMIDVSNDAITDEQKSLVYAARVLMQESVMRVGERLVNLAPGMAVTVEVKTGKRRLIEFILSPLLRYKSESLGER